MERRDKMESDIVQMVTDTASLQVGSLLPIMMLYWRVAAEAFTTAAQAATIVVARRAAEGVAEIAQLRQRQSARDRSGKKSRKRPSRKTKA